MTWLCMTSPTSCCCQWCQAFASRDSREGLRRGSRRLLSSSIYSGTWCGCSRGQRQFRDCTGWLSRITSSYSFLYVGVASYSQAQAQRYLLIWERIHTERDSLCLCVSPSLRTCVCIYLLAAYEREIYAYIFLSVWIYIYMLRACVCEMAFIAVIQYRTEISLNARVDLLLDVYVIRIDSWAYVYSSVYVCVCGCVCVCVCIYVQAVEPMYYGLVQPELDTLTCWDGLVEVNTTFLIARRYDDIFMHRRACIYISVCVCRA